MPDAVLLVDNSGSIRVGNAQAEVLFGYQRGELRDMPLETLLPERAHAAHRRHLAEYFTAPTRRSMGTGLELRARRKDGTEFPVDISLSLLNTEQGQIAIAYIRDITVQAQMAENRRRLEAQLRQASKMEAVGRLAGGITHDFNNLLTVILGCSEAILSGLDAADPLYPEMRAIADAARQSADLTRQLLSFARGQPVARQVLDLNETLVAVQSILQHTIGEDIRLSFVLDADLRLAQLNPLQIGEIVMNLVVNARDAMPDGGSLTVETANIALDEVYCATHVGFLPGDYVMLAVKDTGCGMDEATLQHLFEPFFTTKPEGKGTGLGLASVYGIVKQNEGFIDVWSDPEQGTTFRIYFPVWGGEQPEADASRERVATSGSETILLVDDHDQLRALTRRFLERVGYKVLEAGSPEDALGVCDRHNGEIHLLLTDMMMPTITGLDLSRQICALRPGIGTLFMSGYTPQISSGQGVIDPGIHFLQKPFDAKSLEKAVRKALDRR